MNFTRRSQFFVGRFLSSKGFLQSESVIRVIRTPDVYYRANDVSVKICRKFTTDSESKLDQELLDGIGDYEVLPFKEFLLQVNGEEYTQVLMKALDCGEGEVRKIRRKNFIWKNFPAKTIAKRIEAFKELGVKASDLVEHSSLLFLDFEDSYERLSSLCTTMGCNGHDLFPVLLLSKKTIDTYLKISSEDTAHLGVYANRINYFSSKLKVPVRTFTGILKDHPSLLHQPITKLTRLMNILLDGGIAEEYIFNDLHIFRFNPEKIETNLKICQKAGITNIKPWLLRGNLEKVERVSSYLRRKQGLSGGLSLTEFIAKTLNSSVDDAKTLVKYDYRCEKVHVVKAKRMLDFLLSEGFVPEQILQSPQALITSPRRLKRRIQILKEAGMEPAQHWEFLRRMCYSDKEFMRTVKNSLVRDESTCAHDVS